MRIRNPSWLLVLPILVYATDIGLTLQGQPAEYWRGDYGSVNEANPIPRYFLAWHPLAFLALALAWVACFSGIILFVPRRWAVFVCWAVVLGHTIGTTSWLLRSQPFGPWFAAAFLLTVTVLALPTWRAWRSADAPRKAVAAGTVRAENDMAQRTESME